MKKLFVAATLFMFLGAGVANIYAMSNGVTVELTEKRKRKNKKGEAKSCSAEEKKSCSTAEGAQKSCCSAKKAAN
jgi:hypothetical protein